MQRFSSGSPYEQRYGSSRAVRISDRVLASGSAPICPDGSVEIQIETEIPRG